MKQINNYAWFGKIFTAPQLPAQYLSLSIKKFLLPHNNTSNRNDDDSNNNCISTLMSF